MPSHTGAPLPGKRRSLRERRVRDSESGLHAPAGGLVAVTNPARAPRKGPTVAAANAARVLRQAAVAIADPSAQHPPAAGGVRRADSPSPHHYHTTPFVLTHREPRSRNMRSSRRTEPTYDVVIVGARAAGAATAYLLARRGLDVLLIDRGRYGADTLSTHALMRGGVLQLSRWGLLDKIIAAGTPPVGRTTFRYANDVVPINLKSSYGVDALYAPRRTILDPTPAAAPAGPGAEVRFGPAVRDVERNHLGAVTGIIGRTREGQDFRAGARIVAGSAGFPPTMPGWVCAHSDRIGTS